MSIIFNTLEKLKNDTRLSETEQHKTRKNENVISFDKVMSFLPRLLVFGFLLIACVVTFYYVIGDLTDDSHQNNTDTAITETAPVLPDVPNQPGNNTRTDPTTIEPSESQLPRNLENTNKLENMEAVYTPPKYSEQSNPPLDNEADKRKKSKEISAALPFKPLNPTRQTDHAPNPPYDEPQDMTATLAVHDTEPSQNPALRPDGGAELSKSKDDKQVPVSAPTNETTQMRQQEKIHLTAVNKNSRMYRLVSETKESIFSGNDAKTESLLKELSAHKGLNKDYVTKLTAFWHLRRGKYESAKSLLELLLQKDETDLEAGINMAVLEIRTNRIDQAQTRLEKLRQIYADNTQIPSLLVKIKKHYPKKGS